jgi:hypothetical protein
MRRLLIVPAILALALAACGGDDDDEDAGGAGAAATTCPAEADVETATGLDLALEESGELDMVSCSYLADDGLTGVTLSLFPDPGALAFDVATDDPDAAPTEIAGADEAIWSPTTSMLVAHADDRTVSVMVTDVSVADPLAAATAVAETALG